MHSQIWANASPALDVYAELEDTSPTAAGPCRFPGCGKLAAGAGHGEGYCQTHYKRLKRSGSVEGGKVARRDDLHRAAQDVAERDGATMRLALVRAAVSFASPRLAGVYGREAMAKTTLLPVDLLDGQAARELVSAAVAWADFDAEAPLAEYLAAETRLDNAALGLVKSILGPNPRALRVAA